MDDAYMETEEQQDAKAPATFEEQLKDEEERTIENLHMTMLKLADETIKSQAKQIQELSQQQINFRDDVALQCYVPLIKEVDNYEKAAVDAYRAADAFLRARETGMIPTEKEPNKQDNGKKD